MAPGIRDDERLKGIMDVIDQVFKAEGIQPDDVDDELLERMVAYCIHKGIAGPANQSDVKMSDAVKGILEILVRDGGVPPIALVEEKFGGMVEFADDVVGILERDFGWTDEWFWDDTRDHTNDVDNVFEAAKRSMSAQSDEFDTTVALPKSMAKQFDDDGPEPYEDDLEDFGNQEAWEDEQADRASDDHDSFVKNVMAYIKWYINDLMDQGRMKPDEVATIYPTTDAMVDAIFADLSGQEGWEQEWEDLDEIGADEKVGGIIERLLSNNNLETGYEIGVYGS